MMRQHKAELNPIEFIEILVGMWERGCEISPQHTIDIPILCEGGFGSDLRTVGSFAKSIIANQNPPPDDQVMN